MDGAATFQQRTDLTRPSRQRSENCDKSRRVAPQESLEASLFKMVVVRQGLSDAAVFHDHKRNAVAQRPRLFGPLTMQLQPVSKKFAAAIEPSSRLAGKRTSTPTPAGKSTGLSGTKTCPSKWALIVVIAIPTCLRRLSHRAIRVTVWDIGLLADVLLSYPLLQSRSRSHGSTLTVRLRKCTMADMQSTWNRQHGFQESGTARHSRTAGEDS